MQVFLHVLNYKVDFVLTFSAVKVRLASSVLLALTVKYTIMSGLLSLNIVQSCMLIGDQSPCSPHCLLTMTPERKLGCNAEHRWVTIRLRLLVGHNKAPANSISHAERT